MQTIPQDADDPPSARAKSNAPSFKGKAPSSKGRTPPSKGEAPSSKGKAAAKAPDSGGFRLELTPAPPLSHSATFSSSKYAFSSSTWSFPPASAAPAVAPSPACGCCASRDWIWSQGIKPMQGGGQG